MCFGKHFCIVHRIQLQQKRSVLEGLELRELRVPLCQLHQLYSFLLYIVFFFFFYLMGIFTRISRFVLFQFHGLTGKEIFVPRVAVWIWEQMHNPRNLPRGCGPCNRSSLDLVIASVFSTQGLRPEGRALSGYRPSQGTQTATILGILSQQVDHITQLTKP